jgi:hypothetical protein
MIYGFVVALVIFRPPLPTGILGGVAMALPLYA